jgi:hypothetical protein
MTFRFFAQEKELKMERSITFAKILAQQAIAAPQNRPQHENRNIRYTWNP